ncbi:four helix bundle protein [uncultured Fibrella sp.]|uniref:four helix bundle protein n=1 Tax=uncultured Fibrella sp. TaxID=1284596 RepID=UPI0035C96B20
MATVQRFDDLNVWKAARKLALLVFNQTQQLPFRNDLGHKRQINDASGSIMDNIAEGFGRGNRKEFIQFLGFAMGSTDEVKSQLYRAYDRSYLSQEQFDSLYQKADQITRMTASFINYLKTSEHRGFKYNTQSPMVEEPLTTDYKPQTFTVDKL